MMSATDRKTALVTGGTDGIGKEIAYGLARHGVQLMIVGHSESKANAAAEDLRMRTENPCIESCAADLSSMQEVERLAQHISARWAQLHYLVHSAGVVRGRRELTAEGAERNFAVNYLSRFRLTLSLLPMLRAAGRQDDPARVLLVGGAAQSGRIQFEDVSLSRRFSTLRSVLQFQCANDLFALELARRLGPRDCSDTPVTINVVKYGVVKTNIRREMPAWLRTLSFILDPLVGQTASRAAQPAMQLLLSPEFAGVTGGLFLCVRRFERITPGPYLTDGLLGARLWDLSAKLVETSSSMNSAEGQKSAPACPDFELCKSAESSHPQHSG